ncbi:MAG: N-acetylneuraminate synthase family protein [Thermoplasmatales archaeon]|nr:MAG: N-acetylneuraminate synthase family protein [Thermoplasmatales archaeon]
MSKKIKIISEVGINHNGSLEIAKKLIQLSSIAGFDYVKFQKRTPDICVPEHQKETKRPTPWGEMTYIDYKHKVEFNEYEYLEIDRECKKNDIKWFASAWDMESAKFLKMFVDIVKIPSALITDHELLLYCRNNFSERLMSTGMSTEEEIEIAVEILDPTCIMHANSTYPSRPDELNLNYINWLQRKYPDKEIGYSGHEFGLVTTLATVAIGVDWIERHVTLDRKMWGSDQLSSVEPEGMFKLIRGIRDIESAMGKQEKRSVYESEKSKRDSLRK